MKTKTYRFFFHYNKKDKGMTVHFKKKCLAVKNIQCTRRTETKWNLNKQPNLVMQGWAEDVKVVDNIAYII